MIEDSGISFEKIKEQKPASPGNMILCYNVFIIIVSLISIIGAIKYWAMLMGISDNGVFRFDLAPLHWRLTGTVFAILLPLTALGIWFHSAFGLWGCLLAMLIHSIMYIALPDWFGTNLFELLISLSVVIIFISFQIIFYINNKNARNQYGNN